MLLSERLTFVEELFFVHVELFDLLYFLNLLHLLFQVLGVFVGTVVAQDFELTLDVEYFAGVVNFMGLSILIFNMLMKHFNLILLSLFEL